MRAKVLNGVLLVLLGSLIGGGTWAVAQGLITGRDIRDGSITGRDIRRGTIGSREIGNRSLLNRDIRREVITIRRLTTRVQNLIRRGGLPGAPGAPGQPGEPGPPGESAPTFTSGNFGVIYRNVFGSPVAHLRSGPGDPPAGTGSLGLLVAGRPNFSPEEKIAYGVPVRGLVSRLREVRFSVYTTAANIARGAQAQDANMPNIQFEINPRLTDAGGAITFSTLTFNPVNTDPNEWRAIDATDADAGRWNLTGRAGVATGCGSPSPTVGCTLAQIKERLPDAEIFTVMVNKGRDYEWQGAVDALRVNGRVADFEEGGVSIRVR